MFVEGMLIGLISAVIALAVASALYIKLEAGLQVDMMTLFATTLVDAKFVIKNFAWIFVALGVSIGACGSIVSMRRFLKV
jgi:cell division transport system permease protein